MSRADRQYPLLGKAVELGKDAIVVHRIRQQRAADQHQRPLGGFEHDREPVEIVGPGCGDDTRARRVDCGIGFGVEQILGQDHRDRSRGAAFGEVKGAGHCLRGLFRLEHFDDLLGDVRQQP